VSDDSNVQVERRVRDLLGVVLGVPGDTIPWDAHLIRDLCADSWQFLEFRVELERAFALTVRDADADRLGSLGEAVALVLEMQGESPGPAAKEAAPDDRPHDVDVEIDLGMSLLGRCNLAETPLLKLVGDLRWNHISRFTGVPSRELVDEEGDRLYATFYYTKVCFSRDAPMASYGENERITLVDTLESYGNSIMDGYTFFFPADWPHERKVPPEDERQAEEMGIPYVRLSNIFVKKLKDASWLKKARPALPGVDDIHKVDEVPDSYTRIKVADAAGSFSKPPPHFSHLTPQRLHMTYAIDPDRDINGVGLLYHANYPRILDIAERTLLTRLPNAPLPDEFLDLRTLVCRESALLSNAHQSDSIGVSLDVWMENPYLAGHPAPEAAPVRLFLNYEMVRHSDGRRMAVSSAEKVIFGKTLSADLLRALDKLTAA